MSNQEQSMSKRTYCATCAYFEDGDDYGMGFCDMKQRNTLCGNPACKDHVELPTTGQDLTNKQ